MIIVHSELQCYVGLILFVNIKIEGLLYRSCRYSWSARVYKVHNITDILDFWGVSDILM